MSHDFSDAEPNTFEVIPDGTQVPVVFHFTHGDPSDDLHPTKDKRGRLMKMEAVILDGPFAKRKIFINYMLATNDPEDEGHQKAIAISKSMVRAIIEAARGFVPTDETPAAINARKLKQLSDINGMECSVVLGVDKGTGAYADRNVIKRVVPFGKTAPDGAAKAAPKSGPKAAAAATASKQGAW